MFCCLYDEINVAVGIGLDIWFGCVFSVNWVSVHQQTAAEQTLHLCSETVHC